MSKVYPFAVVALLLLLPELSVAEDHHRHTGYSDAAVQDAIRRGVDYILSTQKADGSWGNHDREKHPTAETAVVCYALLQCGESPQHPQLEKALQWLIDTEDRTTYSLAMRCCAWAAANRSTKNKYLKQLQKEADLLV